ncbi:MAG: hypothetical protein KME20_19095 [Kaiparowitsia implicata GSE-PSE-MK54-09C]|nr:hypothetical protein [Kaiparowitsia implicata GSE-PSE-MK54-09C]
MSGLFASLVAAATGSAARTISPTFGDSIALFPLGERVVQVRSRKCLICEGWSDRSKQPQTQYSPLKQWTQPPESLAIALFPSGVSDRPDAVFSKLGRSQFNLD